MSLHPLEKQTDEADMLDDQFTSAANEQTGQNIYNLAV